MGVLLIIIPIILFFIFTLASQAITKKIHNIGLRSIVYASLGIFGSFFMYVFICFYADRTLILRPTMGFIAYLMLGISIGIVVSIFSAWGFYIIQKPSINLSNYKNNIVPRIFNNVYAAVFEETACRAGTVHLLNLFFGKIMGLIGGSIPFGLIHLLNKFKGESVSLMLVVGVSAAGLLFSVAYLKFGLLTAIGIHFSWNVLHDTWKKIFVLNNHLTLENTGTTAMIFIIFSIILYVVF